MFYAMYCPYGTRTMSRSDMLVRFESKAERDDWCEGVFGEMDGYRSTYNREPVTRDKARYWFPEAFRFGSDWIKRHDCTEFAGIPTGGSYRYL